VADVARLCAGCQHKDRRKLEARYLAGEPIRMLVKDYGHSYQAIARHMRNHIDKETLIEAAAHADEYASTPDLVDRLIEMADEANTIRQHAIKTNDGRLALSAMDSERSLLTAIMDRLGIRSTVIADRLRDQDQELSATGKVLSELVHEQPELARVLAAKFADAGLSQLAELADRIVYVADQLDSSNDRPLHVVPAHRGEAS
jgi:replicative superfamily II helicase